MKKALFLGVALASIVMLLKCGKKSDDDSGASADSMTNINSLNVSCGGKSCLGTEAQ